MNDYHLLFVGVNHGPAPLKPLRAAENDAQRLARLFAQFGLGDQGEKQKSVEKTGPAATRQVLEAELNHVQTGLAGRDLLLVYWSGHVQKIGGNSYYLITSDSTEDKATNTRIPLDDLVRAVLESGAKRRVLMLDTCYGGLAVDVEGRLNVPGPRNGGVVYLLGACDEQAYEGPNHGLLTQALLDALGPMAAQARGALDLEAVFAQALKSMEALPRQKVSPPVRRGYGDLLVQLPRPAPTASRAPLPPADPLERALGYATQAFREYLNRNVVKGVELIYFLSHDVWDGCLIYDGLLQGSIEQCLLDYIRETFLDRDRLRSRYEEREDVPDSSKGPHLGAAGRCFRDALTKWRDHNVDPVERLWYIGRLPSAESEYSEFDQLLGLGCCLYIPVVGPYLHPVNAEEAFGREPKGGILMAANRRPYGLEPVAEEAKKIWEKAREAYDQGKAQRAMEDHINISREIKRHLVGSNPKASSGGGISPFLHCIGGVYAQRGRKRSQLRRLIHPEFLKRAAATLKRQGTEEDLAQKYAAIHAIGEGVEKRGRANDPVEWARQLKEKRVANYVDALRDQHSWLSLEGAEALVWRYLIPCAWRDLKLRERELRGQPEAEAELARLSQALEEPEPLTNRRWDSYVKDQALRLAATAEDQVPTDPRPGLVGQFHRREVNDLIDSLREGKCSAVDAFRRPLEALAPLGDYLRGIAEVETLLDSAEKVRYLHQLAHSVHAWLLGAWLLEAAPPGQPALSLKGKVLESAQRQFQSSSFSGEFRTFRDQAAREWGGPTAPDLLALCWGLIAAFHDIAVPVQRFGAWCRSFFRQYFGPGALDLHQRLPVALDILHHPRFPFYKTALTSLYRSRQRNWLDSVFYLELSKRVDHAIVASLLLVREMEPDRVESVGGGVWRMLLGPLERLAKSEAGAQYGPGPAAGAAEGPSPEQGLLMPAYLAHAVAFSHLPGLRQRWLEQYALDDQTGQPAYFQDVARSFKIKLEEYPLAFLLGLCEALLEPVGDVEPEEPWIGALGKRATLSPTNPFYVSNVSVTPGPPPLLTLDLALWKDHPRDEKPRLCFSENIRALKTRYRLAAQRSREGKPAGAWTVYDSEEFKKEYLQGQVDGWITGEQHAWASVEGERDLILSREAYALLRLLLRLDRFNECYQSTDWQFRARFLNVHDHNNQPSYYVDIGRPSPPAGGKAQRSGRPPR
jgi:hypothetical protein